MSDFSNQIPANDGKKAYIAPTLTMIDLDATHGKPVSVAESNTSGTAS